MNDQTAAFRQTLADAATAYEAAQIKAAEAVAAAGRGRAAVTAAATVLAGFSATDARMAEHLADAARSGAAPSLPKELVTARRAKRDAQDGLDDAQRAADLLEAEAREAVAGEETARTVRAMATLAVKQATALDAHVEMSELLIKAARLRMVVATWIDGRVGIERDRPLPAAVALLQADPLHAPLLNLLPHTGADVAAHWLSFGQALAADPEAPLPAELGGVP